MSGKNAIVVSDHPDGIAEVLKKAGFDDVRIKSYDHWSDEYVNCYGVHLVALDEVNRKGQDYQEEMADAEEALRYGEQGPFLIILISDSDDHLDTLFGRPNYHRRQIVHRESQLLLTLAEQIHAARRIDGIDVSD